MSEPWRAFGLTTEEVDTARRYWSAALREPFEAVPWQVALLHREPWTEGEWAEVAAWAERLVAEGRG